MTTGHSVETWEFRIPYKRAYTLSSHVLTHVALKNAERGSRKGGIETAYRCMEYSSY